MNLNRCKSVDADTTTAKTTTQVFERQSVSQFLVVERTLCGSSTAWRSLGLLLDWLHSSLVFHKINLYLVFCQLNVYSRWFCWSVLWHVRSTACLSVLGKGFFLCGSFWGFFHFCFFFVRGSFSLIKLSVTGDVFYCTDCKAHGGNVIVIRWLCK